MSLEENILQQIRTNAITTLNLNSHQIGKVEAKELADALKSNHSITTLNLSNNQIGTAGIKELVKVLKYNSSITDLYLTNNQIGDVGAKKLAEVLKSNHSITNLNLSNNQIGDAGARELVEALKSNHYIINLNLSNNPIVSVVVTELAATIENNRDFVEKVKQEDLVKQLEEVEVKKYIPIVKFFKGGGGDNQFYNHDKSIEEVSILIRDGNNLFQQRVKEAILLIGDTGAGKSTLAHLFSGRRLEAIMNSGTNEMFIEAAQPLEDIVIGHKMISKTKIPNKCSAGDITIWDCPGFNDTDLVQEIVNSFYIKRIFETTCQLKFVLVIPESDLRTKKGYNFLEMLSNFIKGFKDVKAMQESIALVVTQVPQDKNIQHISQSIDDILKEYNQKRSEEQNALINKFKNSSLHLFHKPNKEGEVTVTNILDEISLSCRYSEVNGDMVNINISDKAIEYSSNLLNIANSNFYQLLEVIVKAIHNTKYSNINYLNVFSESYDFVKDLLPSSIDYNNLQQYDKNEYFLELDLLSELQKVLGCNQIISTSEAIIILQRALGILAEYAEYAEPDNSQLKHHIQGYGYCLQQQYEYMKFFVSVCKMELSDEQVVQELITLWHSKLTKNFEYQVSNLHIDENKTDLAYYQKAIKYLEIYQGSPTCMKIKAKAYSCMASIAEKNGDNVATLAYYVKVIDANSHIPEVYEKLGQLFFNKAEYAKAIDCYKVVNDEFSIEECFESW